MRGLRTGLAGALVTVVLGIAPAGAAAQGLTPGGVTPFDEQLPVNVVFVGFDEADAPWDQVRAQLPDSSEPIVRSRIFYGVTERLGLDHQYEYRPHYTSQAWEDDFFAYLASIAEPAPLTEFQTLYNQQGSALDVTSNHAIDAPAVERRLIDTAPAEVDTTLPTIFFINWHGRPDFRFHVYSKTGEPDPDTGHDFGTADARKLVAWGGTTPDDEETGLGAERAVNRVWFYDLSAGPESWGGSYDITNPDLDLDGAPDYRIPPSWEYGHYRPAGELAGDLGLVTRYVGLNLLFTSSPLYPPYYTADRLPSRVDVDVNTLEGWPGVDASSQYVKPDLFVAEERELPTGHVIASDQQDLDFEGDFSRCYSAWLLDDGCFDEYPDYPGQADIFLSAAVNHERFLEEEPGYEAALLNYAIGDDSQSPGLLGFADDNWLDGTQSGVFSFVYPSAVESGYGLTTTMIHEYGHHSSLSHPHDGYDPATGVDYEPTGDRFFAWLGDESNSMMSYIDLNWDFSQFDRDNSARHRAAGFALIANRLAADVLASPDADLAAADLAVADTRLTEAQAALQAHDYLLMLSRAGAAYRRVRAGAAKAGVRAEIRTPSTWTLRPAAQLPSRSRMKDHTIDLDRRANRKRMAR